MDKAELLYKEYEQKLKRLQSRCKHKELTDWIDIYVSPGHSSGMCGRFCKRCNKRVKTRMPEFVPLSVMTSTAQFTNQSGS